MALRKVAEIQLGPESFHLAKNNGNFHLVKPDGVDAYGTSVYAEVPLHDIHLEMIQHLLNLLGELTIATQQKDDLRRAASDQG